MAEIILPSGLSGKVRELTIQEENLISDVSLARSGKNLHQVFRNCWEETLNPGPYLFEKGFDPTVLLQGDGMVLLVNLRILSQGPNFAFDVNCPACGVQIPWELNLSEYLEQNIKPLPEASKVILMKEGGIFKSKFPRCGRNFTYKLLTLRDEMKFPEIRTRSRDKLVSTIINLSTLEIEGIKDKAAFLGFDKVGPDGLLSSFDSNFFRQEQDAVNCGLETTFQIECVTDGEMSVDLPFRGEFFFPRRKKARG